MMARSRRRLHALAGLAAALLALAPASAQITQQATVYNLSAPLYLSLPNAGNLSLSLCSGPIPQRIADVSDDNDDDTSPLVLARQLLPRLVLAADETRARDPSEPVKMWMSGGAATLEVEDENAWLAVYPPQQAQGTWELLAQMSAEGEAAPTSLGPQSGLFLSDTDTGAALFLSSNYSTLPAVSNLTLLPSEGSFSLPSYFNSSLCYLQRLASNYSASLGTQKALRVNSSETRRGNTAWQNRHDQTRRQWRIDGLATASNYTAWLSTADTADAAAPKTLWPAIKLRTKSDATCRLVSDVSFCPSVGYALPIAPSLSTSDALARIEPIITANALNFSATLSTFACGDPYFGPYSSIHTCQDCEEAYRDWLCAVSMPRCVDGISMNKSYAVAPNALPESGTPVDVNDELLPYVRTRNASTSRAPELEAGSYSEMLPCFSLCTSVLRTCPAPVVQWACPLWRVTARADYGTFADAGSEGFGGGHNGGAGADGQRWGGTQRYVAQDAFGNAWCNALGVDFRLAEINAATTRHAGHAAALVVATLAAGWLL